MGDVPKRLDTPAPGPALLDRVAHMGAVRTRVPLRSFLISIGVLLVYGFVPFLVLQLRPDLPFLSTAGVALVATLWAAAFMVPLGLALIPSRGQVLPDGLRAARTGAIAAALLILVSLIYPTEAPGHSQPTAFLPGLAHCLWFMLRMWIGAFLIALFAVRRLLGVGSWRLGAAIGASAGALSGLALYFICANADRWHVAAAHGGGVVLCATLGALVVSSGGEARRAPTDGQ